MRKNIVPLLAVALVIAGLCTVIFYGLIADRFSPAPTGAQAATMQMVAAAKSVSRGKILEASDLKLIEGACPVKTPAACFSTVEQLLGVPSIETLVEGQPITADLVAKRKAGSSPSGIIPVGMRAVTLHAADSRGVVEMIRSGDRVDLQVIGTRDPESRDQNSPLTVQRVWANVEVLNTMPPDPGSSHNGRPVLTVLMTPPDAERLSLADTTSRIRVVLRNRDEAVPAAAIPAAATPAAANTPATQAMPATPAPRPVTTSAATTTPTPKAAEQPSFLVRLVSVNPDKLAGLGAGSELQPSVRTLSRRELEDKLAALEADKTAQVLGSRPVTLGQLKDTSFALGADGQRIGGLGPGVAGVRFRMRALPGQRWRLEPEAQTGATGAAAVRRSETEATLDAQQVWLVSGLLEHKEGRPVLPGQGSENEPKLVLLVTPVSVTPVSR